MLYDLAQPLARHFILFNLVRYITFRSGAACMTALLVSFIIGPALIRWLRRMQRQGQPIRADGPERHVIEKALEKDPADRYQTARELVVDLRPEAVHQHQLHAHRVEDGQVLHQRVELAGDDHLARDRHDEGLAVVRMDVRRHGAEPRHERVGKDEVQAHWGVGGGAKSVSPALCRTGSIPYGVNSPILQGFAVAQRPSPARARPRGAAR